MKEIKRLAEEGEEEKELEDLEKRHFSEHIPEINNTLHLTRVETSKRELNINPSQIAIDVQEKDFKIIKKDNLINPETGKKTNINRIEFDLELHFSNKEEEEILRFVSLEVPEEYRDLTKCHVYKELIKNTQGKPWAPKLKEKFNQRFITWQKEMMREKDNPQKIQTNTPLEDPKEPTDIGRETLRRGMRTITLEENIVLVQMALRNGIPQKNLGNKQKLEKFFSIKDLASEQNNGNLIRDSAFYTQQNGKKSGFFRGDRCSVGVETGCFSFGCFTLLLGLPTSSRHTLFGFRLAR